MIKTLKKEKEQFAPGDMVKFHEDQYSTFPWYGVIVKVNQKSCKVRLSDGFVQNVPKNKLNFD